MDTITMLIVAAHLQHICNHANDGDTINAGLIFDQLGFFDVLCNGDIRDGVRLLIESNIGLDVNFRNTGRCVRFERSGCECIGCNPPYVVK